jgi:glycosyltransferase involved in cell wall biosynthesis
MRVVYVANVRLPTEKAHGHQIAKMCEAFARQGADVLLLHPFRYQRKGGGLRAGLFEYYRIPRLFQVHTLRNLDIVLLEPAVPQHLFAPFFFTHAMIWALYAALEARKHRADLYYTRDSQVAFWLIRLGLKTVYEAHALPRRAQKGLLRRLLSSEHLHAIVGITSYICRGLSEWGCPERKLLMLPDGVDLSLFDHAPDAGACRRRLGLPLNRTIIGYLGRFQTLGMEKGLPQLVQSMKGLRGEHGGEPLLLGVGGPMEAVPEYLRIARRHGVPVDRIRFEDRVPPTEVPYWVRSFDVAAMPFPSTEHYRYYMSPLKLFEYMAAGVPIVATDLPSLRDVLVPGENGWLVEPDCPAALTAGIQFLLDHPAMGRRMAVAAQETVRNYTWDTRATRVLDRCN